MQRSLGIMTGVLLVVTSNGQWLVIDRPFDTLAALGWVVTGATIGALGLGAAAALRAGRD